MQNMTLGTSPFSLSGVKPPSVFESNDTNVFLLKKIDKEDLRRRLREIEVQGNLRQKRREKMARMGIKISYFD